MTADQVFSFTGIARVLTAIHDANGLFPLRDWSGQNGVILRHDIDLDVEMAVRLAEVEAGIGVRSTILFLTTCDTYNVSSAINRRHLRRLNDDGFEVGLHFDPTIYGDADLETLASKAAAEQQLLQGIIGAPVNSISLHNPSVHGRYTLLPGWINAYDPRIFDEDCYLSDSRMSFRHEPVSFFGARKKKICQLLLHPMHYSETGVGYPQPMVNHVRRHVDALDDAFLGNVNYRASVAKTGLWHAVADLANSRTAL